MPNLIPDWLPWMRPAGRLIWAVVLLRSSVWASRSCLMRRPKPDRPATWAECMAGAVGVFALMTLAYAVIPHEWITFSDKYLQWDTDALRVPQQPGDARPRSSNWPFSIEQARRSATSSSSGIYVVLFGLNLFLFVAVAEARAGEARGRRGEAEDVALRSSAASRASEPVTVGATTANGGDA